MKFMIHSIFLSVFKGKWLFMGYKIDIFNIYLNSLLAWIIFFR